MTKQWGLPGHSASRSCSHSPSFARCGPAAYCRMLALYCHDSPHAGPSRITQTPSPPCDAALVISPHISTPAVADPIEEHTCTIGAPPSPPVRRQTPLAPWLDSHCAADGSAKYVSPCCSPVALCHT
ncbi:hypothetical protein C8Q77DRAFT_728983 [Trametes polyzona]|nr:hypothetical protein C8Q77DRAFT_728983 [Trametes polyzona]